jgi:hypothetical protein
MKTNTTEGMRYEKTKEDKSRREGVGVTRRRTKSDFTYRHNDTSNIHNMAYSKQVVNFMVRNRGWLAILFTFSGVFVAGYLAAKGMKFESLCSVLVALLTGALVSGGNNDARN